MSLNQTLGFTKKTLMGSLLLFIGLVPLKAEVEYIIPLNAKEHQIGNMLEWSTATEINSHNFEIEKSIDGIYFDPVGNLEAAGISGEKKAYRFLDVGVNDPKAFYRLKQVDLDGLHNYSQTVILDREISNQFMVVAMSRTIFDKSFQITMDVIDDVTMDFIITDLKGNVVKEIKEEVTYGLNDIVIDLSDEKDAVYKINIIVEEEEEFLVVEKADIETKKLNNVASKRMQKGG